ncbi:MAG: DUF6049 family protein, partial [Nocardioidaceae bacterium]
QPALSVDPKAQASGLEITLESIEPAVLTPGRPLELSGVVSNTGSRNWLDAQVYLEIGQYPAASLADLEVFSESDEVFTTRIVEYGLFDEIGMVPAGTRKSFQLQVPYAELPIIGDPGVYNVDVTVLAGVGENRDQEPDARTRTLMPLLPEEGGVEEPAQIVTLLPLTAPITRASDGTFVNDRLAQTIGFSGRLRNVLDFALNAPAGSLEIALDPALHAAVTEMSNGYSVKPTLAGEPTEGSGQESAEIWLEDLNALIVRQHVVLLPWGAPATSSLAAEGVNGVVLAAVSSSQDYSALPVTADVVSWEPFGSSRRAVLTSKDAGSAVQIVSEASLPGLERLESRDVPPPTVLIRYRAGTARTVVVRDDIAGAPIGPRTSPIAVRQYLMSEATVQSLSGRDAPVVVSLPFRWDPGPTAARTDLETGLGVSTFSAQPIDAALGTAPIPYDGRIKRSDDAPALSSEQFMAIRALRKAGRVYLEILNDRSEAEDAFIRQFAMSGSAAWESQPSRGRRLTMRDARLFRRQLAEVTVGVPTFVALSSGSGPFPVTVANDLDVAVTVNLSVVPINPALRIDPIDQLRLEPGQQRDVQVRAHAEGSGLTAVRVRLATPEGRRFGPASEIDVRATQIGLAIWIVMGVGVVILVGAAMLRIIRRLRSPGAFSPREEPRHP